MKQFASYYFTFFKGPVFSFFDWLKTNLSKYCLFIFFTFCSIGPIYKTKLVRTKSLSDHGQDQKIWLCKRYISVPKIWSGLKAGPAHVQGQRSDRIWSGTKSGYVNTPCSSDQTECLTFGGKSQEWQQKWRIGNVVQIGQTMKPGLL